MTTKSKTMQYPPDVEVLRVKTKKYLFIFFTGLH